MIMKRSPLYLLLLITLLSNCTSAPTTVEQAPREPVIAETPPVIIAEPEIVEPEEIVEPQVSITQEMYDDTLAEVNRFIDGINRVISSRNYNNWRGALTDEHFAEISSPRFLAETSELPSLKTRNIVLRSPNDYFLQVVVPSRANSRVDEIEFVTENRVKAFFIETRAIRNENNEVQTETRRLLVYELIKIDDTWKIIN